MQEYTLTYSDKVKGFPSFYSFIPDYMIGMNQYFYTFKGGDLYSHNTNADRNSFYGTDYSSTIQSVFNENPLTNKLFKTLNLDSVSPWEATLETDIQQNGFIEDGWFTQKEGTWFGFVRSTGTVPSATDEYVMRSLNGIGQSSAATIGAGVATIGYPTTIRLKTMMSIGDMLYFSVPPYDTPQLAGQITDIVVDLPNGVNNVVINTVGSTFVPTVTPTPTTVAIPIQDAFYLYIKNSTAESHGILGAYCIFSLELVAAANMAASELFVVESEVMQSFP
jgi:hypothetical protein